MTGISRTLLLKRSLVALIFSATTVWGEETQQNEQLSTFYVDQIGSIEAPPSILKIIQESDLLLGTVPIPDSPLVIYQVKNTNGCQHTKCLTLVFDSSKKNVLTFLFAHSSYQSEILGTERSYHNCAFQQGRICLTRPDGE